MKIWNRMIFSVIISGFFLLNHSQAQEEKTIAITNSPFHLFLPFFELTAEMAIDEKISAAAILGYGGPSFENSSGESITVPIIELGGQFRYYLIGSFDKGWLIGLEALYIGAFPPENEGVTASANGLSIGPFVGYKKTASFGLVFDINLGYAKLLLQAKAKDQFGNEIETSIEDNLPILNINFGWAF